MDYCYKTYAIIGGVVTLLYFIKRWYVRGGRCYSDALLHGKTVVITGANTGIGKETAVDLAKRGAIVIMACRDKKRGEAALREVMKRSGSSQVFFETLDLASLASIREFCRSFLAKFTKLHILINNAGIISPYMKTIDGFEMTIGVNHLGHFTLTNLLLQRMVESTPCRIINVSSHAHYNGTIKFDDINSEKNYHHSTAYRQSKLANVLFTKELNRKVAGTGITTYALHPGCVVTEFARNMWFGNLLMICFSLIGKTAEQGAQTSIYCAVQEGIESQSGMYFSDCAVKTSNKVSYDEGVAKKLWEMSEQMTGVNFPL